LKSYQSEAPFDASPMVHFRKRFDAAFIGRINERICRDENVDNREPVDEVSEEKHSGKLLIDATCTPGIIVLIAFCIA